MSNWMTLAEFIMKTTVFSKQCFEQFLIPRLKALFDLLGTEQPDIISRVKRLSAFEEPNPKQAKPIDDIISLFR